MAKSVKFKTIADLIVGTRRLKFAPRQDKVNPVRLQKYKYVARGKQVWVTAKVHPMGDNEPSPIYKRAYGSEYRVIIILSGIESQDTKSPDFPLKIGDKQYVKQATVSGNPVKVSCTCAYFQHAAAFPDKKNKALEPTISPIPYTRKTTTVPPWNPDNAPAACKHILATVKTLRKRGIIK